MSTPTPGASDAPTTPPASPAEANRPPDHGTPGSELRQLRAQLALCRSVIEEARPMVKARLCSLDAHLTGDDSILTRIEAALAGAPVPDELAATKARLDVARAALAQVVSWHSDPESPDYNGCDKEPCAWCEEALAALNTPAGDTGGKEAT